MKSSKLCILILLGLSSCLGSDGTVDLIVHNAQIYTVDAGFTMAQAMAIDSGKIVAIGPEREILNIYSAEKTVDAQTRPIYPGFIDSHCHFVGYGLTREEVDLMGTKSWDECLNRMKASADSKIGLWLEGRGWDQNDWPDQEFPTHHDLTEAFPDRPVILYRVDGHAALANKKAMELAGIQKAIRVSGGEMLVDEAGELTGLFIDNGYAMITNAIPLPNEEQTHKALLLAQRDCFALGLTTVDDAGLDTVVVRQIMDMQAAGELKMRIYAMLEATEAGKEFMRKYGCVEKDRLTIRSIKLYGDGALGSRGAALKKDYHDKHGHKGEMIRKPGFYKQWAALCKLYGYQMNVHCIGDRANAMLLAIFREQLRGHNDLRWRIEHAQVITGGDMDMFGKYNVLPSIQPTHATSDMEWAQDRLGEDRMDQAYANSSLLDQNGIALLGTDFPVEDIDPLKTFYSAVFRKHDGQPEEGWRMDEALTRQEALQGMTIWGAIGNFEESRKGSLEVGKVADFVILDRDIMTVSETEVLKAKVMATYLGGEKVY